MTFNSAAVLDGALTSARQHLPAAEILVVDNGSADASVEIARRHAVDVLVEGHGNVGFGAAANRGARSARGQLILVANPDTTVTAADEARVRDLTGNEHLGVLGCTLVAAGRDASRLERLCSPRFELIWGLLNWFLLPREIKLSHPQARPGGATEAWVTGAAIMVSRREFLELGGFDERLFLYFEDMDLCHRYALAGQPVGLTDVVTLAHEPHSSSPRDEDRIVAWALLSLIEYTASSQGFAAGMSVARTALRALWLIEIVGRGLRRVPRLGARSAQKAQSAYKVRRRLLSGSGDDVPIGAYTTARRLLDALTTAD